MFFKKIMIATMASAFLMSTFPVNAATFGKSSSSKSSFSSSPTRSSTTSSSFSSSPKSNSTSSTTNSTTNSTTSSGGISQGGSVGMSRANVANDVKSGNYTAPANGTTVAGKNPGGTNTGGTNSVNNATGSNYNGNGYNGGVAPTQGYGTGAVVGAAAVGALAGYALSNNGNGNGNGNGYNNNNGNGYNNGNGNGNGYNNNGGMVDNNGHNVNSQSSGSGFGSFIWTLIKIIVGLIVLFFIVRFVMSLFNNRNTSNVFAPVSSAVPVSSGKTPEDEIRDQKENFFTQFQQNNRPSGIDHIRQNSTPVFYDAVEDMVRGQSETRTVKVRKLEAELVDLTQEGSRYIASVRYNAVVSEGESGNMQDTNLKEMWNFVYENNRWKIAGIDQL